MTHGMSQLQRKTLDVIASYIAEHGFSPSFEDISKGAGLVSRSSAHYNVLQLEVRGYITRIPNRDRSIALTEAAKVLYSADDILPVNLRERLRKHCARTGDTTLAVMIDAITEHLDEAEPAVARHQDMQARAQ